MFKFIHAKKVSDIVDPERTLGIEITVASVANRCKLGNIDGQHGHGQVSFDGEMVAEFVLGNRHASNEEYNSACNAAIAIATAVSVPADGTTFATSRPDVDSIGAMAILVLRSLGLIDSIDRKIVETISRADSFRPIGDWERSPLPTEEHPWSTGVSPVDATPSIAHLGMICSPRKGDVHETMTIGERVLWMALALLATPLGDDDDVDIFDRISIACGVDRPDPPDRGDQIEYIYRNIGDAKTAVLASRRALVREAQTPGAIETRTKFAIVRVRSAGAIALGYCVAPVVIAFDQAIARKVTIAAYDVRYLDVAGVLRELNYAETVAGGEADWGGPPTMCSAPQNVGTRLSDETVIETVAVFV